jgi:hypothetical protein
VFWHPLPHGSFYRDLCPPGHDCECLVDQLYSPYVVCVQEGVGGEDSVAVFGFWNLSPDELIIPPNQCTNYVEPGGSRAAFMTWSELNSQTQTISLSVSLSLSLSLSSNNAQGASTRASPASSRPPLRRVACLSCQLARQTA